MNVKFKSSFGLFLLIAFPCVLLAQSISSKVHRILFLGNSITYAGTYVSDIEAYYKVHYPGSTIEFINVGLPSETVSGLSESGHAGGKFPRPDLHGRLERVLKLTKPDMVFACYGMNDGVYMPFDEQRFQKFKDGINWLREEVAKTGARLVHVTPPIYDELRGGKVGYAKVLDLYSDWLLEQRTKLKWEVVDVHYPMKKYLEVHRKVDKKFDIDGFALATDGIHPGDVGHWIIARSILAYLGEKDVVNKADIYQALSPFSKAKDLFKLVAEEQTISKNAWLTAAGHKRPDMAVGLPLDEAKIKIDSIKSKMDTLLSSNKLGVKKKIF
jgi:lysophospholipase L1-like esterase